jgi:hypothetical protein
MDIFNAILSIRPDAKFSLTGNDYNNIIWFDENQLPPPSEEEVLAEAQRLQAEYPKKVAKQQRSSAYSQEADPLFFKYNAGEVSKEEWIAKREEIRQRFPYPEQEVN